MEPACIHVGVGWSVNVLQGDCAGGNSPYKAERLPPSWSERTVGWGDGGSSAPPASDLSVCPELSGGGGGVGLASPGAAGALVLGVLPGGGHPPGQALHIVACFSHVLGIFSQQPSPTCHSTDQYRAQNVPESSAFTFPVSSANTLLHPGIVPGVSPGYGRRRRRERVVMGMLVQQLQQVPLEYQRILPQSIIFPSSYFTY